MCKERKIILLNMVAKKNGIYKCRLAAALREESTATPRKNVLQVIYTANGQALYLIMIFQRSSISGV